ncbi:MAG TPA: serine/threonine-protein kinase, partial [Planctomycetota bacterium]|nr:serine/threonine-protein kinase [Planctomycetota bacterium]
MALNRGDPLERIYAAMMDGGESVPVFPGYTIIERIGAGGFGVVYKAFDEKLQRICAVKLLLEDRAADPASRAAFLHEARVMARVRHPNVLAIYGILEHAGRQALCTEYIEGPPLSERVAEGPLPPLEVARVGMDLSSALQAAHAAGLVHRDVKTSNVLCDRNDRTVLADFGLGVFIAPERREAAAHGAAGSPLFMSPEQLAGGRVDARSDIFSLGVVLYNASTTVFPHTADDIPTLIERVATMTPPPLTARMPDFPPALQAVIMRALGKDPDARYQTAAAMGEALEACCREAAQARKTAGRRDTPRRSAKFAALLGAGAVLAAVLALWPGPDAEAPVFQVHAVPLADTVHGPAAPAARADGAKRLSVSFRADRDLRVYAIREYTETKKYLLCPPPGGG